MSIIPNQTRADVFRMRTEDKNTLTSKGSLYVGTGNSIGDSDESTKVYETTELKLPSLSSNIHILSTDSSTTSDNTTGLAWRRIAELVYPVGSIYLTTSNINPGSFFGGVWESWGQGRTIFGVNENDTDFSSVTKTGGSKELQSHSHTFTPKGNIVSTFVGKQKITEKSGAHTHVEKLIDVNATGVQTVPYCINGENNIEQSANIKAESINTLTRHGGYVETSLAGVHEHYYTPEGNINSDFQGTKSETESAGNGNSRNLPPYITCYMWKRIS